MNVSEIKKICNELGIVPTKKMGQNFLINEDVVEKILEAGELSKNDTVLEIGPGLGVLTWKLAERVGKLIAVEADRKIFEYLNTKIQEYKNTRIINEDVLKISNFQFPISNKISNFKLQNLNYKIISNLPYQITSPVLWKFLNEEKNKPGLMVIMIQKEVGERIMAKPGKMSILSVLCQFYADVEKVCEVSRGNFWPSPEVDSMVIKLKLFDSNKQAPCRTWSQQTRLDEKEFFRMVKIGFSQKRKMLKNNLSNGLKIEQEKVILALKSCGLNEKVRAQELSVENWIELNNNLV